MNKLLEIDANLMKEIINYLIKQPFIEVHDLLSRINPYLLQHDKKLKGEEENADNTGS